MSYFNKLKILDQIARSGMCEGSTGGALHCITVYEARSAISTV